MAIGADTRRYKTKQKSPDAKWCGSSGKSLLSICFTKGPLKREGEKEKTVENSMLCLHAWLYCRDENQQVRLWTKRLPTQNESLLGLERWQQL
jgi:hypothetical protein